MFGIFGRAINKFRDKIGREKYTKIYETTPEDWENIPESLKVERGELKAKVAKLERQVVMLEDALKAKEDREKVDVKTEAARRARELAKQNLEKVISFKKTINRNVKVMSKDNKELGYFYDFGFTEGDNPGIVIFCSSKPRGKGTIYKVWQASSIQEMIHNAHTLTSQIKAGFITLNRDYQGRFIPDLEYFVPIYEKPLKAMNGGGRPVKKGKPPKKKIEKKPVVKVRRNIEDYVGELTQTIGTLTSELNAVKEALSKETTEKEIIASTRRIERVKGETAMTALHTSMRDLTKWFSAFIEMIKGIQEERIKNINLDATITPLMAEIEQLRSKVTELRPKEMRDSAIADIIKLEDMLARLAKVLPTKETIVREEKTPPPAPTGG